MADKFYLNYVGFKHTCIHIFSLQLSRFIWTMWDLNRRSKGSFSYHYLFYLNYVGFKLSGLRKIAWEGFGFIWTMWDLN